MNKEALSITIMNDSVFVESVIVFNDNTDVSKSTL